ncbi:M67 family metallopeptidase [Paenibacillus sp. NPDC058071]|uniref:M67 family metallopeptidase n=1 Tax=Paenibacillus sp. NPDC058071 TaxID=3346326 RepID=UPI0036D882D4
MNGTYSIKITQEALRETIELCRAAWPQEACGILLSPSPMHKESLDPFDPPIEAVRPIANTHRDPLHSFAFDPAEWTAAYYDTQKSRQKISGFFHSHPSSEALPSVRDVRGYWPADDSLSYWIVSLSNLGEPVVRPFARTKDGFQPLALVFA